MSDLHELQPDVVKGLISLLQWNEDDDGGAVEEVFGLDFQVMHKSNNGGGDLQYHDLLPQGSTIDVTAKNRVKYVELYLDWYMNEVVAAAFSSFALGFWTVVDGHTLRLFSPSELELLIEGENTLDMVRRSGVGRWARRVDFLWPLLTLVVVSFVLLFRWRWKSTARCTKEGTVGHTWQFVGFGTLCMNLIGHEK